MQIADSSRRTRVSTPRAVSRVLAAATLALLLLPLAPARAAAKATAEVIGTYVVESAGVPVRVVESRVADGIAVSVSRRGASDHVYHLGRGRIATATVGEREALKIIFGRTSETTTLVTPERVTTLPGPGVARSRSDLRAAAELLSDDASVMRALLDTAPTARPLLAFYALGTGGAVDALAAASVTSAERQTGLFECLHENNMTYDVCSDIFNDAYGDCDAIWWIGVFCCFVTGDESCG